MKSDRRMPKRILSLDGGGTRGVISLAFLERLEKCLERRHGRPVPFHEHFDLIGGTSTGAIIATALALGKSLKEIKSFYFDLGPNVFRPVWHRGKFLRALFNSHHLRREFQGIVGDRRLDSPDLKTGLAIFAKRVDTGSVWFLSNNDRAKYWDDREDKEYKGNRRYELVEILLASTAAPTYFDPLYFEVNEGKVPGLFIDGGVSPYNNPSLALFMMATIPAYRYGWPVGEDNLDITSIGTGFFRYRMKRGWFSPRIAGYFGARCLESTLSDSAVHTLTLMQALGRNETPWLINSEIGDLSDTLIAGSPLFNFRRYDLVLEKDWLLSNKLAKSVTEAQLEAWRDLTAVDRMKEIYDLATAAAEKQIPF